MGRAQYSALGRAVAFACLAVACAPKPLIVKDPPPPIPPLAPEVVVPPQEPLKLPEPLVFATGTATLSLESEEVVGGVADRLKRSPEMTLVRIEGHTDNVGASEQNQKLSEGRAATVANLLIAKGIECKRLVAVGYGESRPLASNDTAEGRAQNRRLLIVPAAINGHAVDADPAKGGHRAGDLCAGRDTVVRGPNPFQQGQLWAGSYKCREGQNAMRLIIESTKGTAVAAVFDFGALPGSHSSTPHGAFHLNGTYDVVTRKLEFKPGDWIEHPPTFSMLGLRGEVTVDGTQYFGSVEAPGCTQFSANLKK